MRFDFTSELINWFESYLYLQVGVDCKFIIENDKQKVIFKEENRMFVFCFSSKKNTCQSLHLEDVTSQVKPFQLRKREGLKYFIPAEDLNDFSIDINNETVFINSNIPQLLIEIINRSEEYQYTSREAHKRFQLKDSILYKNDAYKYPIVDIWISLISDYLQSFNFKIRTQSFTYSLSCDIDNIARFSDVPVLRKGYNLISGLIKNRNETIKYLRNPEYYYENIDVHNKIDFMISEADKQGLKICFNIITSNTSLRYDYRYKIGNKLKKVIDSILHKDHSLGIHYSYNALKKSTIKAEWLKCNKYLNEFGLSTIIGRFHYLRITIPEFLSVLGGINQTIDETITFHETGGFRCGTSRPFKPFNLQKNMVENIVIQPLILMEGSLLGYSGNDSEAFKTNFLHLLRVTKGVNGCFSLLWHNSDLQNENSDLFKFSLNELSKALDL